MTSSAVTGWAALSGIGFWEGTGMTDKTGRRVINWVFEAVEQNSCDSRWVSTLKEKPEIGYSGFIKSKNSASFGFL